MSVAPNEKRQLKQQLEDNQTTPNQTAALTQSKALEC